MSRLAKVIVVMAVLWILLGFSLVYAKEEQGKPPNKKGVVKNPIEEKKAQMVEQAIKTLMKKDIKPIKLDLKKAIELAYANNTDLKVAKAKVEEAYGKYLQARSALNFKMDVVGSYTRIDPVAEAEFQLDPRMPPKRIKLGDNNNWAAQVTLKKVITTFGKVEYAVAGAYLQVEVYKENYKAVKQQVKFNVKKSFYTVQKAEGLVKIAKEYVQIAKEQLKITEDMYKEGVVPRFEVLRAKLRLSKAKQNLIKAENGRDLAKSMLLKAIGIDVNTPVELICCDVSLPKINTSIYDAQVIAIRNRPEVKAAVLGCQSIQYMLESAKRYNSPILSFSSSYQRKTVSGFNVNGDTWTQMLVLSIPILDGGEGRGKIKQMKSQLDQVQQTLLGLYRGVKVEVKNALLTLKELDARLSSAKIELETAKEGYSIAMARYENGISTGVELDDAIAKLNAAKINYNNLIYDYVIAVARVEKATAVTWKGDKRNENEEK